MELDLHATEFSKETFYIADKGDFTYCRMADILMCSNQCIFLSVSTLNGSYKMVSLNNYTI